MTAQWALQSLSIGEIEQLAKWIGALARKGDVILLRGELGSGKTTFARFLIRAVMANFDIEEDIPSPSYFLVQDYHTERMQILHYDFYRINEPSETDELGVLDSMDDSLVLIEWPEKAPDVIPENFLEIRLEEGENSELRTVLLRGAGHWHGRLERLQAAIDFLSGSGWTDGHPEYLQGDASARAYVRLSKNGLRAILMDSPRQADGPPVRSGKSYSTFVHLAEDVKPFIAVATALKDAGIRVPEILAYDLKWGFILLEDLGDRVYTKEIAAGVDQEHLYLPAVDVLLSLAKSPPPSQLQIGGEDAFHRLPDYEADIMLFEAELIIDWYWPAVQGSPATDSQRSEFCNIWRSYFTGLQNSHAGWVLRDFHSPNLMRLEDNGNERSDIARVGVIDFQDALYGPLAYDLVSLLQDARVDLADSLEEKLFDYYCAERKKYDPEFGNEEFKSNYALLGAQRNSKIIGIFTRLAVRDGKKGYLGHLPRIWKYLERNLLHPSLKELKNWYDHNFPAEDRHKIPDF